MDTLTLTLMIDGKEKKFTTPNFIKGKLFRVAAEIATEIEKGYQPEDFDKYFKFVCDVFGNQFDVNQLEEGLDARKVIRTVYGTAHFVVGNIEEASKLLFDGNQKSEEGETGN
ncbi:phage tail assembly chaperone G [Thermaerobacillus caldiproteolyticus]|uniref:phage tail assembly chaperone G n=1 Tax=Thermaerobacillus caldiproteolyticus TaxID=247480 RepID=UPI0018F1D3B1|nr:hypothetical protein [Anoxybacillus caldiproteolyticus]